MEGLLLSRRNIGLNWARREGNGVATEELRRSSVALIWVEGIVALATLAKSFSGDDGERLELNRGVPIDLARCGSLCPRSVTLLTLLRHMEVLVQDSRGYCGEVHPYAILSRVFFRSSLDF